MTEHERPAGPEETREDEAEQPTSGPTEEPEEVKADEAAAPDNTPSTVQERPEGMPEDPYSTPTVQSAPQYPDETPAQPTGKVRPT